MALFDYLVNLIQAGNVKISGNKISSENVNGNIELAPNGTGWTQASIDSAADTAVLRIANVNNGGSAAARLLYQLGTGGVFGNVTLGYSGSAYMRFGLSPTGESMRINATGLGIGSTAPGSKLGVSGGASIGSNYAATAAPTNGAIIEGKAGVGSNAPAARLHVLEASTAPVAIFETETTGANPKRVLYQFRGQTNAAAFINVEIGSITVPPSAAGTIQYSIIGTRNNVNDYAHVIKARGFKASATVVSGAGSVATTLNQSDNAYTAAEYMNGSDLVIRFRVTGDSVDTMTWHAHVTMDIVS